MVAAAEEPMKGAPGLRGLAAAAAPTVPAAPAGSLGSGAGRVARQFQRGLIALRRAGLVRVAPCKARFRGGYWVMENMGLSGICPYFSN